MQDNPQLRPPAQQDEDAVEFAQQRSGLFRACLVAIVSGVLIGVVGAVFRECLMYLGALHVRFSEWSQGVPAAGWLLPVLLGALAAALARLLVRAQPLAAGSGVQHVEAVMRGQARVASVWIVPVKFLGGLLALGSGLALGREGPTVQMGATIGGFLARLFRCAKEVVRDVQAALGGAGLAVAFNAPLGGAMFVFEEVARSFRLRLAVVTLLGTLVAIVTSRMILGSAPDFAVTIDGEGQSGAVLFGYAVFGGLLGLLGVLYNRMTLFAMDAVAALRRLPPEARAALVGAVVGGVAYFAPHLVGGGDDLSQKILGGTLPFAALLVIFIARWLLGPLSYAAGTPGGLFAPLLLVGAVLGALFAVGANHLLPVAALPVGAFAVVGMAAFFTGVVRAPLTGILLISEMTATTLLIMPMIAACLCAMLTATLVRGEPIYDTLRHRMLDSGKPAAR